MDDSLKLNPIPRGTEHVVREYCYEVISSIHMPIPQPIGSPEFLDVVMRRRSRSKGDAVNKLELSKFLYYSSKVISQERQPSGFVSQQRPSPSAGGRHPIDLLVGKGGEAEDYYIYDPLRHCLLEVHLINPTYQRRLCNEAAASLSTRSATFIFFLGQISRTSAKYENPETLLWRDSGCLLATMGLVAEALGLNFCASGITGNPWIQQLFGTDTLLGLGAAVLANKHTSDSGI